MAIEAVLPAQLVASACARPPFSPQPLHRAEARHVERAVPARRLEFSTGRACARRALTTLGHDPVAVPAGRHGEPLWPPGVVGSITHCPGYVAAATAWSTQVAAVGIDAEPHAPLPARVARRLLSDRERQRAAALGLGICGDRLAFSLKEAAHKAWFRLLDRPVPLVDLRVELGTDGAALVGWAGDSAPGRPRPAARWAVIGGLVVTAVVIPLPPSPPSPDRRDQR